MNTPPTYPQCSGNEARAYRAGDERDPITAICPICYDEIEVEDAPMALGDDGTTRCRRCHNHREEFDAEYPSDGSSR